VKIQEKIEYLGRTGIMLGSSDGYFFPKAECTRAMAAKIIYLISLKQGW
jgi:hypothetical protein